MSVFDFSKGTFLRSWPIVARGGRTDAGAIVDRVGIALSMAAHALLREPALARSRRALRDLPDNLLADVGLTRSQARAEAAKSTLLD